MPAAIIKGGLLTKCENCSGSASFGHGVNLKSAMIAKEAGNIGMAKKNLARWFFGVVGCLTKADGAQRKGL